MTDDTELSEIYHYEQITDWLATSGQPSEAQFARIAAAGYNAVINLALPSSDNAITHEGSIVTAAGMRYFHIPVLMEAPTLDDLRTFSGLMNVLDGKKIWVHCVVNARVSAFVYLYLKHARGFEDTAAKTALLRRWEPQMDAVWRGFLDTPASLLSGYLSRPA